MRDPPMSLYYRTAGVRCYEGVGPTAVMVTTRASYCWAYTGKDGARVFGSGAADATRLTLLSGGAPLLCATDGCNCVRDWVSPSRGPRISQPPLPHTHTLPSN